MYSNINDENNSEDMNMVNPNKGNYNILDNMDLTYMPGKEVHSEEHIKHSVHSEVSRKRHTRQTIHSEVAYKHSINNIINNELNTWIPSSTQESDTSHIQKVNADNKQDTWITSHVNTQQPVEKNTVFLDNKLPNLNTQTLLEQDIDINDAAYSAVPNDNDAHESLDHSRDNMINNLVAESIVKQATNVQVVNKASVQVDNNVTVQDTNKEKFNNIHPKNVSAEADDSDDSDESDESDNSLIKIVSFGIVCLLAYSLYKNKK